MYIYRVPYTYTICSMKKKMDKREKPELLIGVRL